MCISLGCLKIIVRHTPFHAARTKRPAFCDETQTALSDTLSLLALCNELKVVSTLSSSSTDVLVRPPKSSEIIIGLFFLVVVGGGAGSVFCFCFVVDVFVLFVCVVVFVYFFEAGGGYCRKTLREGRKFNRLSDHPPRWLQRWLCVA